MFIETQATSDPAKLQFLPGREVLPDGTLYFKTSQQAAASPLVERLFTVEGVVGVSLAPDAITVTRSDAEWQRVKPVILGLIMDHYMSGEPMLRNAAASARTATAAAAPAAAPVAGETSAVVEQIRDALRLVIDPELGYNIVDLGLIYQVTVGEGGTASVLMTTTTPGCPATNYLRTGAGEAAGSIEGITSVEVEMTYEPRWGTEMMSPEAKAHFGIDD